MIELPLIMVAPNGARRTMADHPALPVTIDALAYTAAQCLEAGAGAIHVHVRDQAQRHVLDAGLYRRAIAAIERETGGRMPVQITTEAVGQYTPEQQRAVVLDVMPEAVSIAVGEMIADESEEVAAASFYKTLHEADIAVQHIIYEPQEIVHFDDLVRRGIVAGDEFELLFALGRHAKDQQSEAASLLPFLTMLGDCGLAQKCAWAVCAFGVGETRCLAAAMALGGKVRVGFENSLCNGDGSLASDNAERVAQIARLADEMGLV